VADVEETKLPGLGIRYEFLTARGSRVGVIHHRTGRRELLLYDQEDPDTVRNVVALDPDDCRTLAELLGGSRVAEQLEHLQQVEGLAIDWLPLLSNSPFAGATIGDTEARRRTGVSIFSSSWEPSSWGWPCWPGWRGGSGSRRSPCTS
jgi:TrkA domain protein